MNLKNLQILKTCSMRWKKKLNVSQRSKDIHKKKEINKIVYLDMGHLLNLLCGTQNKIFWEGYHWLSLNGKKDIS